MIKPDRLRLQEGMNMHCDGYVTGLLVSGIVQGPVKQEFSFCAAGFRRNALHKERLQLKHGS